MTGLILCLINLWLTPWVDDSVSLESQDDEDMIVVGVNTSTREELMMVPYMTPGLAACIIKKRPFDSMDELVRKCKISDWYASKLAPYLSFSDNLKVRLRLSVNSARKKGSSSVWLYHKKLAGGFSITGYGTYHWFATAHLPYGIDCTVGKLRYRVPLSTKRVWWPSSYGERAFMVQKKGVFDLYLSEKEQAVSIGDDFRAGVVFSRDKPSQRFIVGEVVKNRLKIGAGLLRDTSTHFYFWIRSSTSEGYSSAFFAPTYDQTRLYFSAYPSNLPLFIGVYMGKYSKLRLSFRASDDYRVSLYYLHSTNRRLRVQLESSGDIRYIVRAEFFYYQPQRGSMLMFRGEKGHFGVITYVYNIGEHTVTYFEPDGTTFQMSGSDSRTAIYGWVNLKSTKLNLKIGYSSNQKFDFSAGVRYVGP